ncbi:synaptotagmin-15 isoform X1 [Dunckerocampus dactyliophorus]|uniref:synaptotagmin-15 isoform X1 n=1 Tax=Dunckerocampus dactyliophorus TaxID=161453 RepID=UPI00240741E1|nr:synaptotagmin-15 isoform X1 [Dunckerocampus dactyliophorus]XP_054609453.1 synaptotagmin-15 isoform X1 [Dunckerocampus dactyliophorus]
MVLVAVCLTAGLLVLLLLGFVMFYLWRRARDRRQYQDLVAAVPPIPVCTAPVLLVSQGSWVKPAEIPFTLPPLFTTPNQINLETEEGEEKVEVMKMDVLTHRGSLSVQSWYPVGTVLAGLYSNPALSKVVAPPPGIATRLCFSVEYRYSSEQLAVSLLRLGNLPPRFHGNVTLVQLRLLPEDRRPRQAKARCTGPDPEFNECFLFQVSGGRVTRSTLSVCVLSVSHDSKRHAVGRVLFPLQGELGQAGRVLWRDLETEDHNHVCTQVALHVLYRYQSHLISHGIVSHISFLLIAHLISTDLITSYLTASFLTSSHLISLYLTVFHPISLLCISPHHILSLPCPCHLISKPHLITFLFLILSQLRLLLFCSCSHQSHLISSHLILLSCTSSHCISSHCISSHCIPHFMASHIIAYLHSLHTLSHDIE